MIKTYTNEGEGHRYTRLLCVEMLFNTWYAYAYADDLYTTHDYHQSIIGIHDHKGALIVTWKTKPDESMKHAFEHIWEMLGELKENVTHEIETNA